MNVSTALLMTVFAGSFASSSSPPTNVERVGREVACQICLSQMGGGGMGHSFQSGGSNHQTAGADGNGHVAWKAGSCSDNHNTCDETFADAAAAFLAAADQGVIKARDADHLVKQFSHHALRVQSDRVVLSGCDGEIVVTYAIR